VAGSARARARETTRRDRPRQRPLASAPIRPGAPIDRRRFIAAGLAAAAIPGAFAAEAVGPNAPFVPTPEELIDVMLRLARVRSTDLVCDLGSGDGRIPITAAKKFGARGLGIEIDGELVAASWRAARAAGVAERVRFIEGDIFATDFSQATVVTLYLLTHMNDRLRPKLFALEPGTRIVAHNFGMNDWDADEVAFLNEMRALLWVVPLRVAGRWRLRYEGESAAAPITLELGQSYQKLWGDAFFGNARSRLSDAAVRGDRMRFAASDPSGALWTFHGRANASTVRGFATDGARQRRFAGARL
jgi:methylase of polypeptide subunit release factors